MDLDVSTVSNLPEPVSTHISRESKLHPANPPLWGASLPNSEVLPGRYEGSSDGTLRASPGFAINWFLEKPERPSCGAELVGQAGLEPATNRL